jgi:hypothetical protein
MSFMVFSVELVPAPAITGTLPFVSSMQIRITVSNSASLNAGLSPVVAQATIPAESLF